MNSSELKGYLTGLILGDASIDKGVTKRALKIKSINYEFINKIYNDISGTNSFKIKINEFPERTTNGVHHKKYWELTILSHPYFVKMYHHFYTDTRSRTLSKEATKWLNAVGLANWYMSDGYVCLVGKTKGKIVNRRVDISTDRYPKDIVERMSKMLLDRFGIHTSVIKRNHTYRLRVLQESYEVFFNLIKPHVVSEFQYKLYLGYEMQPKWMSDEFWDFQMKLRSAVLCDNADEDIVYGLGTPREKSPFQQAEAAYSAASTSPPMLAM